MQKPIISLIGTDDSSVIEPFCTQFSKHILLLIRSDEVYTTLNSMIRSNIENSIESGAVSIRRVLGELVGEQTMLSGKSWVKNEVRTLLQSSETAETIDSVVDALFEGLQKKKIGKLANIIPAGIKDGVAGTLQKMVSVMLADEVPGLVQTLNIRNIVIERVNSLDLLQLERLLLSIMEEQFKYINLFGALLGFLLGCLNLLFLYGV